VQSLGSSLKSCIQDCHTDGGLILITLLQSQVARHDIELNEDDDESEEDLEIKTYQENPHFIVISSFDRNWEDNNTNTTQYNFQLKFSPSSNTINNVPLYQNNPTIPATSTQPNIIPQHRQFTLYCSYAYY
jgi:hypothetical protein